MMDKYGFGPEVAGGPTGAESGKEVEGFDEEVEGMIVLTGWIKARTKGELRIELCFLFGRIIMGCWEAK
jgi:hypothetical protein